MEEQDLLYLTLPGYILGSNFCCQNLQNGGVCVFLYVKTCISAKLLFYILSRKGFEICAVELQTKLSKLIILSSCRVPTRDFNQSIKNLDDALKYL
jgi:hypothetical protein